MIMEIYTNPEISFVDIDLASFLCVSIGEQIENLDVDPYENKEHELIFDE